MHQMKKNRNDINLPVLVSAIRGNTIIQIAAPPRLVIVENGMIFGYTIYGM
jgi:hypothetical protein